METPQRPDTASVNNPTRLTAQDLLRATSPEPVVTAEQPVASTRTYTVEDYIDTREHLQDTKRFLAKAHREAFEGDNAEASKERPVFEQYLPKDNTPQELQKWEDFVNMQPNNTHNALRYLQEQSAHLTEITSQPGIAEEITKLSPERQDCLSRVSAYRHLERRQAMLINNIETARLQAISLGEQDAPHLAANSAKMQAEIQSMEAQKLSILSQGDIESNLNELERRSNLDKKRQLDDGLLLTTQMEAVLQTHMTSAILGQPILIVGETGGAKTALAREIARRIQTINGRPEQADKEPLLFSGYGEANTYQLMGKNELGNSPESDLDDAAEITTEEKRRFLSGEVAEGSEEHLSIMRKMQWSQLTQGTETYFVPGPLVIAMQEGLPIILDEVNAMPPEILKRLNTILQLKPGDTYTVQEDSGLELKVKPGFCVIATANEKSHRYKGVDDLSVELLNRFTANTARVPYPDMDVEAGETPPNLLSLALVAVTDEKGEQKLPKITTPDGLSALPPNESLEMFLNFVRVCHFTQKLFTQPSSQAEFASVTSTEQQATQGKTALKENVLAPRTMVKLIEKAVDSGGDLSLNAVVDEYLKEIKDPSDKALITKIFKNYGFESEKQQ
jgi:MoxR-like ATPase